MNFSNLTKGRKVYLLSENDLQITTLRVLSISPSEEKGKVKLETIQGISVVPSDNEEYHYGNVMITISKERVIEKVRELCNNKDKVSLQNQARVKACSDLINELDRAEQDIRELENRIANLKWLIIHS